MTDDPERLIADALRAQAARTPLPEGHQTGYTSPVLGSYGLLSGSGVTLPESQPGEPTTVRQAVQTDRNAYVEPNRGLAAGWVILLAILLGLAAGAVVGVLTLV